jgi:hypothetical protein
MKFIFILYGLLCFADSYRLRIICRNCKYFIPSLYGGKYELQEYYGKCGKFIKITGGEIEYDYAYVIRQQENKCGENAKYFIQRNISLPINGVEID